MTLRLKFALICLFVFLAGCNFHEIDPLKLYRSGQLGEQELIKAIEELGIRTVINLRGANPGERWYDEEKEVTTKYNVLQIDIGMSAGRIPYQEDLVKLLDAYRDAPRPILIHCQAGADRTGEAAAIYQMLYMNKSRDEALQMLTPKYFHFEERHPAKRYFIREVWQSEDWARNDYDSCSEDYRYPGCK